MSDKEKSGKHAIDRPCSACSGGDYEMKYHDHDPPFRKSIAAECRAPAPQPVSAEEFYKQRLFRGQYDNLTNDAFHFAEEFGKYIAAVSPQVTPTDARIQEFWNAQAEWSRATFGSDEERDHIGPLKHLAKEAVEAQVRPADRTEIADCQFLVFDAARRSGMTLEELFDVCDQKLLVNKARKWSRPTSDNPVEHVREGTSEQSSPTPDECPTCGSTNKTVKNFGCNNYCTDWTDPWHSSPGTPKGTK